MPENKNSYSYPQSSCFCYSCESDSFTENNTGVPTNLAVRNCSIPNELECYNQKVFKVQNEPTLKKGYEFLNTPGVTPNPYFYKLDCKGTAPCDKITYISTDPRLLDVRRNILTKLDRPPVEGSVCLRNIYNDNLRNYGQNYRNYSDVNTGQIQYYIDNSIEDAFYEPVFDITSENTSTLYIDPMGVIKPQYNKTPLVPSVYGKSNYSCLTSINDTSAHREDIMQRQQLKYNQTRYEPRWTGKLNF